MDEKKHMSLKGGKTMMYDASIAVKVTKEGTEVIKDFRKQMRKQEIQALAIRIFQRKLDFTFKPDADPEAIQKLVDSEPFQYYLEEATKQCDKRQKALAVNKTYPVIEVPADGKSGMMGGAYVLAFVYSKHKGNVVVKGYMREVEEYVKKNFKTHYFVNYSLWYLGSHRDIWKFWKKGIGIHEPTRSCKRGKIKSIDRKYSVRPYVEWNYESEEVREKEWKEAEEQTLYFKRMPKRWIPEFDNF